MKKIIDKLLVSLRIYLGVFLICTKYLLVILSSRLCVFLSHITNKILGASEESTEYHVWDYKKQIYTKICYGKDENFSSTKQVI